MTTTFVPDANRLAKVCYQTFESISKRGKPVLGKEWTVLSCIAKYEHSKNEIEVVSMGTGTRCIGRSLIVKKKGELIHDSHAEVMCRRGFLVYLYNEISKTIDGVENSIFSFDDTKKKFSLSSNVSFHFLTTFAPCGDATIFEFKPIVEPSESKRPKLDLGVDDSADRPLENFTGAKLIYKNTEVPVDLMVQTKGDIRTKPGRGEPNLSCSCSDKLARWNVLGCQGALIFNLLDKPIYFSSITLSDSQYCNIEATERAIYGRFSDKKVSQTQPFYVNRPIVQMSEKEFKYRKEIHLEPAPGSIVWMKGKESIHQVSVNGKLQGATKKFSGRLKTSKFELFRCYLDIMKKQNKDLPLCTYGEAKQTSIEYQEAWKILKKDYFNVWATKPSDINLFTVN